MATLKGQGSPKTQHHRATTAFQDAAAALAKRVRTLRLERGWSTEAAAERMHIEPAHVRRIESSTANPSLAVLVSVAGAFKLTVSELLSAPSTRPRDDS